MARTQQGRAAIREAVLMGTIAGICSLAGSGAPLLFAAITGVDGYPVLAVTVAGLGVLGFSISRVVHGRWLVWVSAMLVGGCVVTFLGILLHIV